MNKLSVEQIKDRLERYEAWVYDEESIKILAGFEFENFADCIEFTNSVAEIAEELDHHPDILIHDYKYVTVFTNTVSINGITESDFDLIKMIEEELVS